MPKKIFIIDDDMTALDLIDFLFEEEGFEVTRSATGISAIALIKEADPDLILVDLMMPQMSGIECIERIRALEITVPIVAFTAADDRNLHEQALAAGCSTVLTKPCKPLVLLERIQALL
jgi:CheY-like chemotaxis protein